MLAELKEFALLHRDKGRSGAFGFDDNTTETYLKWAYTKDYLFVVHQGSEIAGVGVAYPFTHTDEDSLLSFNAGISRDKEHLHSLCIMDVIALNSLALKELLNKFKIRFPHWDKCEKWAYRFGEQKLISNKYLNLL